MKEFEVKQFIDTMKLLHGQAACKIVKDYPDAFEFFQIEKYRYKWVKV